MSEEGRQLKKPLRIIGRILTIALLVISVTVMLFTIISVTSFNKERGLFGYSFYIVLSDSMEGVFNAGDVVVSGPVDTDALKPGDIITFRSVNNANYGEVVTHMIREVMQDGRGLAFVTYGVRTNVDDPEPVPADRVIGQYRFNIPKVGFLFNFLRTPMGYICLIFIPFALLLLSRGVKFFSLLKQYKGEQLEAAREQQDALVQERQKTDEMQAELARLKEQLNQQSAAPPVPVVEALPIPVAATPPTQEQSVETAPVPVAAVEAPSVPIAAVEAAPVPVAEAPPIPVAATPPTQEQSVEAVPTAAPFMEPVPVAPEAAPEVIASVPVAADAPVAAATAPAVDVVKSEPAAEAAPKAAESGDAVDAWTRALLAQKQETTEE